MLNLPQSLAQYERIPFLFPHFCSIDLLSRLSAHLTKTHNVTAKVWIKREDCNSGIGLGGNKIRKLEYVLPDAIKEGCDTVITTGGPQSNHIRQVAAAAAYVGMKTILVPQQSTPAQPTDFHSQGNVQIASILSATYAPEGTSLAEAAAQVSAEGHKAFVISGGASTHRYGGLGFARWAFEISEQERQMDVHFDTIVVAVASGSTIAGMLAGFALVEQEQARESSLDDLEAKAAFGSQKKRSRRVIGVDTYNKPPGESETTILRLAKHTAEIIGVDPARISAGDVLLDRRNNVETHSGWSERTREAVKLVAGLEGVIVDPIYSGRAVAAVLEMARVSELDGAKNVLVVHTGGQPALSGFSKFR